jgi:hypothetical protein
MPAQRYHLLNKAIYQHFGGSIPVISLIRYPTVTIVITVLGVILHHLQQHGNS